MTKLLIFLLCSSCLLSQGAVTWSDPIDLMPKTAGNLHPRIAVDGAGNPLVIFGHTGTARVLFTRWNGSAFTTPVVVNPSNMPAFYESWAGPDIAARGDTVYIVFKRTPEDKNHVYCVRSFDGGKNFSMPVIVDNIADSISRFPAVSIDALGNPLVAFMKFDPNFGNSRWVVARSTDAGMSFMTDVKASGYSGGTVCDCCPGTIIASGSTVAMVYRDNLANVRDTWVGVSTDNGQSFGQGIAVDKNKWVINACPASGPDAVILGDTMYSTFMSSATGKGYIYHNHNNITRGESSTAPKSAAAVSGLIAQNYPRIAAYGNAVAEVWQQSINNASQVALAYSANVHNGLSTKAEVVASAPAGAIINADVELYDNNVYVVYQDDNAGTVKLRRGVATSSAVEDDSQVQHSYGVVSYSMNQNVLELQLLSGCDQRLDCSVINMLGQNVLHMTRDVQNARLSIDCTSIPQGTYLVRLQGERTDTTVLVQRQ